jgi:hypothetical protein
LGGGAQYVENADIKQQTLIKEDDVEVFVRSTVYKNKVNKTLNKLISRLKWIANKSKFEIYEQAVGSYFKIKNKNIEQQQK